MGSRCHAERYHRRQYVHEHIELPPCLDHSAQFLAVAPDGTVLEDETIGERGQHPPEKWFKTDLFDIHSMARGMLIGTEQIGTEADANGVGYVDLPLPEIHKANLRE